MRQKIAIVAGTTVAVSLAAVLGAVAGSTLIRDVASSLAIVGIVALLVLGQVRLGRIERRVDRLRSETKASFKTYSKLPSSLGSQMERTIERAWSLEKAQSISRLDLIQDTIDQGRTVAARDLERLFSMVDQMVEVSEERHSGFEQLRIDIAESVGRMMNAEGIGSVAEIDALLTLRTAFDLHELDSAPVLGGWAMNPRSLLAVIRALETLPHGDVVELGPGESTLYLASFFSQDRSTNDTPRTYMAVEHQQFFADRLQSRLGKQGLQSEVEVRHCPLKPMAVGNDWQGDWYSLPPDVPNHIALLIVDGPPATTSPEARWPALPNLVKSLVPGALIVLDDAQRADEREFLKRWLRDFGLERVPTDSQGVALLRYRGVQK